MKKKIFRNIMSIDSNKIERNLGEQPIAKILEKFELNSHDLVAVSTEQINHKMISKARKGRRLSCNVKLKVLNALNKKLNKNFIMKDIFNY